MRVLGSLVLIGTVMVACSDPPQYINAHAALPPPGATAPRFSFATLAGDSVSDRKLRGSPAVLALWSTQCPHSVRALEEIETIRQEYRPQGVQVLILASNTQQELQAFFDTLSVATEVGVAGGGLAPTFDHSESAPERAEYRVKFALPSFLVLTSDGRVAERVGGMVKPERLQASLDSLIHQDGHPGSAPPSM